MIVALLASRYPNATASQIKDALLRGADGSRNPVATAPTNGSGARLSQYGYLDVKKALDILEAASLDLGPKSVLVASRMSSAFFTSR